MLHNILMQKILKGRVFHEDILHITGWPTGWPAADHIGLTDISCFVDGFTGCG